MEVDVRRGNWNSWWEFFLSGLGFMVGFGNIWRFPYLCYKNGGGAFLLPYLLFTLLLCAPLLMLIMSFSQFCNRGPATSYAFCPLFKGLGYGCVLLMFTVSVSYNVILAWTLYYLGSSFKSPLPWISCSNSWNSANCLDRFSSGNSSNGSGTDNYTAYSYVNVSNITTALKRKSPTEEFWDYEVLQRTSGIGEVGVLRWELVLCLIGAWIAVFLIHIKGIRSAGKVVYVTSTLPYVMMIILLVRGAMLPGALEGIRYFIIPRWEKLAEFSIWRDAAIQVFYSAPLSGGLVETLTSYSKFHNNTMRDAILFAFCDAISSLLAGFVVFVVLGFMAFSTNSHIDDVISQGPGVAFIAYPEALGQLPLPQLWSVLFFIMMVSLGIDSQIVHVHGVTTAIYDLWPNFVQGKETIILLITCTVQCLLGLVFVTQGGVYILQILDWYLTSVSILTLSILQCIALSWIYGSSRLYRDIEMMIGYKPHRVWKVFWCAICPSITMIMLVYAMHDHKAVQYGEVVYPGWAGQLGLFIALLPVLPFPITCIYVLAQQKGNILQRLRGSVKPDSSWGPALPECAAEYRLTFDPTAEKCTNQLDDADTEI